MRLYYLSQKRYCLQRSDFVVWLCYLWFAPPFDTHLFSISPCLNPGSLSKGFSVLNPPSSHKCPTESSELFSMVEKMCAAEAALLNSGMSKKAVCVDSIVCPFGNLTINGFLATFLFNNGAFVNKKCPVQPESTTAVSLLLSRGGVRQ
jgi:hypothetical protein